MSKYIVVVNTDEEPAVLGPFVSLRAAQKIGEGLSDRWDLGFEVHPIHRTIGEYLRAIGDTE